MKIHSQLIKIKNAAIINVRGVIFGIYEKCPLIGAPLVSLWRVLCAVKFIVWKKMLESKVRLEYSEDKVKFDKIVWVDANQINYVLKPSLTKEFTKWQNYSGVLDGDWDMDVKPFENLDVYQAFRARFREGKAWEKTEFYSRVLKQITRGIPKWGCRNETDWKKRLKGLDTLYYQIKKNGIYPRKESLSTEGIIEKLEAFAIRLDDISIVVGRNGELLFVDGRHRLSIAKLLNIKVPIRIMVRHKKWMDFRKELLLFAKIHNGGVLYQPLTHPDLRLFPHQHGALRFEIIKKNLSLSRGKLLDIGAELGYFSCRFEDEGFDCYAVEENRSRIYFLNKIKKAENRKFNIIPQSIFEYKKNQTLEFDVVLALNVFHHFLDKKDVYENMIKLLKRLKTKEMFFEPYRSEEFKNRYREYTPEQFVDFVIKNSCLNKAEFIGKAEDGRSLYKLTV